MAVFGHQISHRDLTIGSVVTAAVPTTGPPLAAKGHFP